MRLLSRRYLMYSSLILSVLIGIAVAALRGRFVSDESTRRTNHVLTEMQRSVNLEDLRRWARPYLTNSAQGGIPLPEFLATNRNLHIWDATVGIESHTGDKFVILTMYLGQTREAILVGETNATIYHGEVRVKLEDGIYYVLDHN
jgi:hypothetical protein